MDLPSIEKVGEQIQNWTERANQWEERIYQKIGGNRPLAVVALALAEVGLMVGAINGLESIATETVPVHVACAEPCAPIQPKTSILAAHTEITPTPTTETTVPESPPAPSAERVPGIDPTVEANIGNMKLSIEGYKQFLQSVDYSVFDYAQQFVEFNPRLIRIPQAPTQFITIHYTAFYRNQGIPDPQLIPLGKMDPLNFVLGMAKRYDEQNDHKCCGINAVVDRDGIVHQFAPVTAKLRHNKGRDGITTGLEFEAAKQQDINTSQYEHGAYMLIAMWKSDPSLRNKPFSAILKGHGETRAEDRIAHPELDVKTDYMAPASEWYRRNIQLFLNTHPEVANLHANLR